METVVEAVASEQVEEVVEAPMRMLNLTKHFTQRWVERVVGIKDEKERNEYMSRNQEQIKEHANRTFHHATYLWSGQLGDNVTRHYYIEDDIIILTNTTNDAFITTYRIDFGFPAEANAAVRKSLIQEIRKYTAQKEEVEFRLLEETEAKHNELMKVSEQIKIVKDQLKSLEQHEQHVKQELKTINIKSTALDLEIKKNTNLLLNSKEYREDLQKGM